VILAEIAEERAKREAEIEAQRLERERLRAQRQAEREAKKAAMLAEKEARRDEREARRAQREAERAAAAERGRPTKPVAQLTDDGVTIMVFPSVAEASRALSIDKKCIRDAANGKQRRAAGYCWAWCEASKDNGGNELANDLLYSEADKLLDALKASKPDKAFTFECVPMKDGRTISLKVAGGILCYVVFTRQGPYIRIETSHELEKNFPTAEHLANDFIKLNMDLTFDMDTFVQVVGPLCEELFDASATMQFGCCNDFVQCSDLKRCFKLENPDSRGCSYRKNLEAGRIFYGKNKTI
jgi:hypothetical protein